MPYLLAPNDPSASFPQVGEALTEPDGLLAIGGDLGVKRLVAAYRQGIFPWYGEGDPILWWSPDPRTVLLPNDIHISRSLSKLMRNATFEVTMDRDFPAVINACALPRPPDGGTWLVPEMINAYRALHLRGIAHSVEVWKDGLLAGGLYGVAIGRAFFGESMFTRVDNASKVALVHLCKRLSSWGFGMIDCQVLTGHLLRMGARQISRANFVQIVEQLRDRPSPAGSWDDIGGDSPKTGDVAIARISDGVSSHNGFGNAS
ncbi:MAG: leucyl/phenylalanyl-tRNA--protein transferase [Thiohalocapsa sp.]